MVDLSQDNSEIEPNTKVMSIHEHLDELRTRALRCLVVLGLSLAVALCFGREIVRWLELPAGNITFQALSLEEPLLVYFKVSCYAALALSLPWLLLELSCFIAPGLQKQERKVLAPIVCGGPILFASGAAFAYYIVLPPMLRFFNLFGQAMSPIHQRLDYYISLVTTIMLYMGLCFQLPIIIFALSFTGLVNSSQLLSVWRYIILGAAVAAAIITPDPTAISMLIVMSALIGLYFVSVGLLKVFGK